MFTGGGCKESRRSTTGSVLQIGESIVDWSCKKHKTTVALPSCEAEYIAGAAVDDVGEERCWRSWGRLQAIAVTASGKQ
jgi:hypothetical protein